MEKIAVVGIGKLGLCFALNLESVGFEVLGIDINESYVSTINNKTLKSTEPNVESILQKSKHFIASSKFNLLGSFDAELIFIMVATPSMPDGSYDHSQIERVLHEISILGKQKKLKHLVVGCTVMPGYCNSIYRRIRELNYTVSYNPEFIAQGTIIHDQKYPDQVLIGEHNIDAGNKIEALYRKMCASKPIYCRMDTLSAEICKLATNSFLTMKISFANSIGDLAIKAGADEKKILSAIGADSRIGNKYLKHGFGFGGPCFPRDNKAIQFFAKQYNHELPLSVAADKVNSTHLEFQLHQWLDKTNPGEEIIIQGVAYKAGTTIIEESQQLKLALALAQNDRKVIIIDSENVIKQVSNFYGNIFTYKTEE